VTVVTGPLCCSAWVPLVAVVGLKATGGH
jgi:hypothetical protein